MRVKQTSTEERKKSNGKSQIPSGKERWQNQVKNMHQWHGSRQRVYLGQEEAASPTIMTQLIQLTVVIDAKEHWDIATADIPSAFVQTDVLQEEVSDWTMMKVMGLLVDS